MKTLTPSVFYRHNWHLDMTDEDWRKRRELLNRREKYVARAITRHLAAGRSVTEHAGRTETKWSMTQHCFVNSITPDYIGRHIARRVFGFGWALHFNS